MQPVQGYPPQQTGQVQPQGDYGSVAGMYTTAHYTDNHMVVTCCRYGPGPARVGAGAAGYGQAAGAPAGMAPIQQQQQAGYGGMQEQPMQTGHGYEMQNVGNGNGAPALGPGSSLQAFFQEVRPSFSFPSTARA